MGDSLDNKYNRCILNPFAIGGMWKISIFKGDGLDTTNIIGVYLIPLQ